MQFSLYRVQIKINQSIYLLNQDPLRAPIVPQCELLVGRLSHDGVLGGRLLAGCAVHLCNGELCISVLGCLA